ncbi:hypothetical protein [Luteolibacter soli]|uniref:Lytic murein transglycosylase n=1 Tax=Luteolibacter soli TaxID=3135280 RepID=A0ABU9AX52_9BACT
MMKPSHLLLVGSHLAVLGLVYGIARSNANTGTTEDTTSRHPTKVSDRSTTASTSTGDGPALLASFIEANAHKTYTSPYDSLKATLPVATDPEAAAREAIAAFASHPWPDLRDWEASIRRLTEAQVRVLHWLRQSNDPAKVLEFLFTGEHATKNPNLGNPWEPAIFDVATQQGILKSWPWLLKSGAHETIASAALKEMKSGGGLRLILSLESAMAGDPQGASFNMLMSGRGSGSFYQAVGKEAGFDSRESIYGMAMGQQDPNSRAELLLGFARSSEEAATWLLQQPKLDPELAKRINQEKNQWIIDDRSQDYEHRLEAFQERNGEKGDRQGQLDDLVRTDLNKVLTEGRDWRYEFRHGTATLDEVVAATRAAMPAIPPDGEQALTVSLYRHLAEENPAKALPLLDALPEEERRNVLFDSTWQSMVNVNPDDFLTFTSSLPEPVTATEKDLRTKGWNWKARGFLQRYGDDYVEWVQQMPEGIDKDTAMNSLIWATREQNPAAARKLNEQLFPPQTDEKK